MKVKFLFQILIVVVLTYSCGERKSNQGKPAFTPSAIQMTSFEQRMDQLAEQLNLTGLSAALVNNREIVWGKNWGASNELTAINTPQQIGAMTNIFIPVIIVKLMEEGKLDLNDPVIKYLTDYNGKASIKHLLSHTSEGNPATTFGQVCPTGADDCPQKFAGRGL